MLTNPCPGDLEGHLERMNTRADEDNGRAMEMVKVRIGKVLEVLNK